MKKYINSSIGRFRLIAFLEGISLLILVFIAMPIKYGWGNPALVKSVGQIHGILFILFILLAITISLEQEWRFKTTTWKVLLASFIPFGTFYIDKHILSKIHEKVS
jgi:integral membrane protein